MNLKVILGLTVAWGVAPAQEQTRPLAGRPADTVGVFSLGFNRELNTFLWSGDIGMNETAGAVRMDLRQHLKSRLIRTEQSSFQDEYEGRTALSSRIDERWTARLALLSNVLSDSRSVDLGRLSQHQLLGGFLYEPSPGVEISGLGGYQLNTQEQEKDQGPAILARADFRNFNLEEFRASLSSEWAQSALGQRSPHDGLLGLLLARDFGDGATDTLTVQYNRQRRDFYVGADPSLQSLFGIRSNIFRRQVGSYDVFDQLSYRASRDATVFLQFGIANRTIDRGLAYKNLSNPSSVVLDNRIEEFQLHGTASLEYAVKDWLKASMTLSYRERDERHSVVEEPSLPQSLTVDQVRSAQRLDNISRLTSLSSDIVSRLTDSDRLFIGGRASILRYDTPDTLNVDDRDELLITLGIEESHTFNRYCTVILSADVSLNHLVYLNRLQSANNDWNRVFRIAPRVEWAPASWMRSTTSAEVLANYTVYDFEDQVAFVRSFSFRQASWYDSTTIRLGRTVQLSVLGGVRMYERGILRWTEFKEKPENYFVEQQVWPQLFVVAFERLRVGVGYRFFAQDRFGYDGSTRILQSRIETSGPTAMIEWGDSNAQRLSIEGWRQAQLQDGQVVSTISNLSMKILFAL